MSQVNNESKDHHDFDWVSARQDCSTGIEFGFLHRLIEKNTEARQKGLADQKIQARLKFEANDHEFTVHRTSNGRSQYVSFALMKGCITVKKSSPAETFDLTLTFTDAGEFQFRINGEGEYLRWQVARKALEEIFFYGLFPKKNEY